MKRSEINGILSWAEQFVARHGFRLPPFAFWAPEDWRGKGHECDEVRRNMLGWDVTDFGRGEFDRYGLVLFTVRNGNRLDPDDIKPYAEKIMITRLGQATPLHFHWAKVEDIINRAGGDFVIELFNSTRDERPDTSSPVSVSVDGVTRTLPAGGRLTLEPGESVTLVPGLYHKFWAKPGTEAVLVGEVSAVNDDKADNRFAEPTGRFPEIEEDEAPLRYLCNEYPEAV